MATKDVPPGDPKDAPPDKKSETAAPERPEREHRKSRKHGYRGYPNNPSVGGNIHIGTGFGGAGVTATTPSGGGIIGQKTRESVEELGEEEEDEK